MLAGVITDWQLATLLKLALFFRYFLGFITRLMILKLRNKLYKCNALNFLDLNFHKFPPHMNPFPLNTPNFTINVMLHRFTHRNSIIWVHDPRTFGMGLIPATSSTIRRHSLGRISPLAPFEVCESTKPSGVYTVFLYTLYKLCIFSPKVVVEGNSGQNITFCIFNWSDNRRMVYPPSSSKYLNVFSMTLLERGNQKWGYTKPFSTWYCYGEICLFLYNTLFYQPKKMIKSFRRNPMKWTKWESLLHAWKKFNTS